MLWLSAPALDHLHINVLKDTIGFDCTFCSGNHQKNKKGMCFLAVLAN